MHRFLTRLSFALSLTIISSCTLQITQVQLPNGETSKTTTSLESPSEDRPLDQLDEQTDAVDLTVESEASNRSESCDVFEFPSIEETPQLPYIPPERRGDDEYVSEVLVEHVNRLTTFIENAEKTLSDSYQKYLDRCR
jgi:hypothetical protein